MPTNNNAKKQSTFDQASSQSSNRPKAAGTRYGTFLDWRESSGRGANGAGRYGQGIRDGR